jgi:superfamily II DNA or RNA helicase
MGSSATIEREDELHKDFPKTIGGDGILFQVYASDLARNKHLASYEIQRRQVDMLLEEFKEYNKNFGIYQVCLKKVGVR